MGFCSTYAVLQRFEMYTANFSALNILGMDIDMQNQALLFTADNVDHNILTIDENETFHGMGMIAALTPGQKTGQSITRQELNIVENSKVNIVGHHFSRHVLQYITFRELLSPAERDNRIDLLWELPFNFKHATPGCQGMMHFIRQGNKYPGQYSVRFIPIVTK